jgi:hypothetical protein
MFTVHEFVENNNQLELTGWEKTIEAEDINTAVGIVVTYLLTHNRKNIKIGPTGRCVYCTNYSYSVVPFKGVE